ncbi:MAG: DUF86 domain-containing protein [Prevotellaceae bacterium]|nr:DUF86 domain-containing protein [Candidatus Minthosoma caballi]
MASTYSTKEEKTVATLHQIKDAILQLQEWNKDIHSPEDYVSTTSGMKELAAASMLIVAIGEGFKNVDKLTDGNLLPLRPEIPWKDVKGIRDKVAHGYFDIDNAVIFESVKYEFPELLPSIDFFIQYLSQN